MSLPSRLGQVWASSTRLLLVVGDAKRDDRHWVYPAVNLFDGARTHVYEADDWALWTDGEGFLGDPEYDGRPDDPTRRPPPPGKRGFCQE